MTSTTDWDQAAQEHRLTQIKYLGLLHTHLRDTAQTMHAIQRSGKMVRQFLALILAAEVIGLLVLALPSLTKPLTAPPDVVCRS